MKKIAILFLSTILFSCNVTETRRVDTQITIEVTYTNGEIDTLTPIWNSDAGDLPQCYLESNRGDACVCITSHGELGLQRLACGVRKIKELSRKEVNSNESTSNK